MKDFEIDLLDFEINDLNNSSSEIQTKKNNKPDNNSLDFEDNLDNKEKTINEIAASNNLVENIVFPDDDKMPQLDEDIINLEFTDGEDILPNSIQPLTDADVVFNLNSIDKNNK
jgi:hypothetical protein